MMAMTPSPEGVRTINHQKESSMIKSKKPALKFQPQEGHRQPCHFFASSVASWKSSDNLDEVLAWMKKDGYPFNLWKVPLPADADYKINMYAPAVEGCTFIGFWGFPEE